MNALSSKNVQATVAERLHALRKARGFTRKSLMDACGLHWDVIRRVELNLRPIDLTTLYTMCEALDQNPRELIQDDYAVRMPVVSC